MGIWQGSFIILAAVSAFPSLYGLYRLLRWMKQRGWLSWRGRRTRTNAMSCFLAMQQIIEPAVKHVREVQARRGDGENKNTPAANGFRR